MDDIKDIFNEAHRWEILIIIEHFVKNDFFGFISNGKTIPEIEKKFGYDSKRFLSALRYLEKINLIEKKNEQIFSTDFSEEYLSKNGDKFIGNYLSWKIDDIYNWRTNISKVLEGELESVYTNPPLIEGTEENGAPLQEIIAVCGFLYPSKEFSEVISKYNLRGTLMDLGCGTGEWSFLIGQKFKELNLIEVDYNPQNSKQRLSKQYPNLSNRTEFIKGDFLKINLPLANIALVSNNFMEYSDLQIKSLIDKLKNESKTETLLIHEFVLDEDDFPYQYDVYCSLVTKNGRLRTKEEWKSILKDFKNIQFIKLNFGSYAILANDKKLQ
jgi:SAM-dependent methyltransferase